MKQKLITTSTATILVVELPEGENNFIVHYTKINTLLINYDKGDVIAELPMWSVLIGRLPEVTEEQASQLFERDDIFKMYQYYIDTVPYMFTTGLETLLSLLEANGTVFENPISNDDRLRFTEWLEYQRNLWDRNRTYIFKQVK